MNNRGTLLGGEGLNFLEEIYLLVIAQHDIYTLNRCCLLRRELCETTRNCDYSRWILAMYLTSNVATLLVCVLGYGATIDDADICLAAASGALKTSCLELASKCRTLCKIEFATKCVNIYFFVYFHISLNITRSYEIKGKITTFAG